MRPSFVIAVGVLASTTSLAQTEECEAIPVWRDGHRSGEVCRADAAARGLTIIDLGEDWLPAMLEPAPDGNGPTYRATYLALAQERFADAGSDGKLGTTDR